MSRSASEPGSERSGEHADCLIARALTPVNGRGAIGVIQIRAHGSCDLGAWLASNKLPEAVGRPVLSDLLGVDEGLVVRWDQRAADLFCHGGPAVIRRMLGRLTELGTCLDSGGLDSPGTSSVCHGGVFFPEANGAVEHRMLETLTRASSPLAVDLLLDQPRRWRESGVDTHTPENEKLADGKLLGRLIDPPLVAAVGPANVGKSSLLNRLAGRSVALVADAPGTTRDHVGASLDLGGLVVRYLDTPGVLREASGVDAEASRLAMEAVQSADLILLCGDPSSGDPLGTWDTSDSGSSDPELNDSPISNTSQVIRVCLRSDLGDPGWGSDLNVSVKTGSGLDALVADIRERLVPSETLRDPRPWQFWKV